MVLLSRLRIRIRLDPELFPGSGIDLIQTKIKKQIIKILLHHYFN